MAAKDVRLKQRYVIEFLNAEGETPIRIHERLKNGYGDSTVDVSTVRRWVHRCDEAEVGQSSMADAKRTGRPSTAVTPHNIHRVDDIIRGDRRVTLDELYSMLSISKGSVQTIIKDLGYSKVCARWVPRILTDRHKETRKTIAINLLHRYETEGEEFLSNIVTGDETWVHFFYQNPRGNQWNGITQHRRQERSSKVHHL